MPSSVGKLVALLLLLLPALTACETAGSPAKGEVTEASGARAEPARFTSDDQRLMSRTRHLAL
ncbi:MAG: hypothetical protein K2Q10_02670, partial [Rhodospirillales bacterium]|nr:hypothetical protein [Rhodospirillales bacterium]